MKKRSMILALASMLGISAAATAVSGFAWFTTQTTAAVNGGAYKVGAAQGSLVIGEVDQNVNCTSSVNTSLNSATVTPTGSKSFADVSSIDGVNFFKLYELQGAGEGTATSGTIVKEEGALSSVNANQMVYVSWQLSVTNEGETNPAMDVYLTHSAANLFTATTTTSYVDCYRLAIFDTAAATTPLLVYSKTTTGFKTATYTTGSTKGDGTVADATHISEVGTITTSANVVAKQKLLTLAGGASKTLKFVVWCEGTDTPNAAISTEANGVSLAFSLIGLKAAA